MAKVSVPDRIDRRRREHLSVFFVLMLVLVAMSASVILRERDRARAIIDREDLARSHLLRVRRAESAYRTAQGRYGWIEDLAEAGLLDGLDVVPDATRSWVRTPGYRIDVLLPHARLGPDLVGISPRGASEAPDPELSTRHVAVIARPLVPMRSGFRMWYVDEQDELFLNEGVVDDEGARRNELPLVQVRASQRLAATQYLLWQKASEVPQLTD